eukprot:4525672-Amphidinium_carterae.1
MEGLQVLCYCETRQTNCSFFQQAQGRNIYYKRPKKEVPILLLRGVPFSSVSCDFHILGREGDTFVTSMLLQLKFGNHLIPNVGKTNLNNSSTHIHLLAPYTIATPVRLSDMNPLGTTLPRQSNSCTQLSYLVCPICTVSPK